MGEATSLLAKVTFLIGQLMQLLFEVIIFQQVASNMNGGNQQQDVSAVRRAPKESRATGAAPRPPQWKTSAAKALLARHLSDELSWIHQATSVKEVYEAEPLFQRYPFKNFKTNFVNLKASIKEEKDAINFDQAAFKKEKEMFPRNSTTKGGNPFWDMHEAQRLLAEDVKAGKTLQMKPSALQETRSEYQAFPLSIFRGHKYQEERKEREAIYWQKKRNDKGRKMHHEKEADKLQE